MAKRKVIIPEYGTVMKKGVLYYRTRIKDANGKLVALYAKTPEELYNKETIALEQIENATFHRKTPTVAEYCEKWLLMQSVHIRATTLTDYTSKVRRHIIAELGDKRMGEVSLDDIQLALVPVSKKSASVYVLLNNNVKMPKLGYGVFQVSNEECERCVLDAISVGYRAIDTAQSYGNEEAVGNAIQKCGVPREELFLTSKIWMSNASYEKAKASIDKSLHKLKTDYLDLMLIHQPFGDYYGAYRAMEEAYKEGKLRAIGVSNFYPDRLIDLCQFAEIAPMVNQVETHVFQQQRTAHEYMKKYGVQHEAWGPFAEGKKNCFTNPVLVEIGEKYGKTAAQTALRFLIQSDVVVIPKSTHKERMEQNLDVFDFSLSEADMEAIRTLDEGKSLFFDHYDPSTVEMLTNMGKTRIV